jgi:A/G-specific adenine glycosylase
MSSFFTISLLHWNRTVNSRQMPWKGVKDPYKIWLSEIILQQTRVEQGRDYYHRFIEAFPTITQLADAADDKVFKLWEGLGYYTRCRNLLATARFIAYERMGKFPEAYKDILDLKGVGPYTASAIASFAYSLPHAVVDGNVVRILSRVFGIASPVNDPATVKLFLHLADDLLAKDHPAEYNQAIMDFGAMVCKPRQPFCDQCPLQADCEAFRHGWVDRLPVKAPRPEKRKRYLHYILFHHNGNIYCRKRVSRDIWQNLFEFYLVESDRLFSGKKLLSSPHFKEMLKGNTYCLIYTSPVYKQQLTHQDLSGRFIEIRVDHKPEGMEDFIPIPGNKLSSLAMPRFILSYLHEKNVNLNT